MLAVTIETTRDNVNTALCAVRTGFAGPERSTCRNVSTAMLAVIHIITNRATGRSVMPGGRLISSRMKNGAVATNPRPSGRQTMAITFLIMRNICLSVLGFKQNLNVRERRPTLG